MKIEMLPAAALKPYPANPRVNAKAVPVVAKSIREFGFRNPILIDANDEIVAGHTRHQAGVATGMTEFPCIRVEGLTPDQIRAFRIADNQTASIATWDDEKLVAEVAALAETDIDLDALGFSEADLNKLQAAANPTDADDDDAPDVPAVAVTQPGEVFLLGDNRLICGDATEAETLRRLTDDGKIKVDLLLTDPPYGVDYEGKDDQKLKLAGDTLSGEKLTAFLAAAFRNAATTLNPGAGFYIWHASRNVVQFCLACAEIGWDVKQTLIWVKQHFTFGRQDYQWRHEPCLYGWTPGKHRWLGDRKQSTVLEFPRPMKSAAHPTMKPVDLFAYQINNSCPRRGHVLDLFAGSGTAIIAAERSGRKALLVEIDPLYCDVIRRRWAEWKLGAGCDWVKETPSGIGGGAVFPTDHK